MAEEIVKMSSKGQLVVPKSIREQEGFEDSDRFIAVPVEDGVVFKKIDIDVKKEYEELTEEMRNRMEEKGLSEDEVEEAVEWAKERR